MNVVHIHQDYPDGRPYPYTKAVENLIKSCQVEQPKTKHIVISVNRTSNPFKINVTPFEDGYSFVYWAIPLPFIYYISMWLTAFYIHRKIAHIKVDLFHGHKLTSEGLLAFFLSRKKNKPYVLSIRGGSDFNNINRLPQHRSLFRKVFLNAASVFWVSAWAKSTMQEKLSLSPTELGTVNLLPNICNIDLTYSQKSAHIRHGYVTAVSYHQYKRKGLSELISALASLKKNKQALSLNIYGTGSAQFQKEIEDIITKNNATSFIHLMGAVKQDELIEAMSNSKGFLMPAVNETFGMAYIEALSVGCPILYVGNTGIDGYFTDENLGQKVDVVTTDTLQKAITIIDENNTQYCQDIHMSQKNQLLAMYTSNQVVKNYLAILNRIA